MLILFVPPLISILYFYVATPSQELAEALSSVFGYMVAVLAFLLAFQLDGALESNADGIRHFNQMCSTLVVMSIGLCAVPFEDNPKNHQLLMNVQHLSACLPGLVKWHFRSDVEVDKLYVSNKDGDIVYLKDANPQMYCKILRYASSLSTFEGVMYELGSNLELLTDSKSAPLKSWYKVQDAWKSINDVFKTDDPIMVEWFMNVCMLVFVILLPIQFVSLSLSWNMACSFTISYFFLGLWIASRKVDNPFVENAGAVFPTVSEDANKAANNINSIFNYQHEYSLPCTFLPKLQYLNGLH